MPLPTENQTQEEFLRECVPIVLEDGTASDPEQAVAVCISIWEDKQNES